MVTSTHFSINKEQKKRFAHISFWWKKNCYVGVKLNVRIIRERRGKWGHARYTSHFLFLWIIQKNSAIASASPFIASFSATMQPLHRTGIIFTPSTHIYTPANTQRCLMHHSKACHSGAKKKKKNLQELIQGVKYPHYYDITGDCD